MSVFEPVTHPFRKGVAGSLVVATILYVMCLAGVRAWFSQAWNQYQYAKIAEEDTVAAVYYMQHYLKQLPKKEQAQITVTEPRVEDLENKPIPEGGSLYVWNVWHDAELLRQYMAQRNKNDAILKEYMRTVFMELAPEWKDRIQRVCSHIFVYLCSTALGWEGRVNNGPRNNQDS